MKHVSDWLGGLIVAGLISFAVCFNTYSLPGTFLVMLACGLAWNRIREHRRERIELEREAARDRLDIFRDGGQ